MSSPTQCAVSFEVSPRVRLHGTNAFELLVRSVLDVLWLPTGTAPPASFRQSLDMTRGDPLGARYGQLPARGAAELQFWHASWSETIEGHDSAEWLYTLRFVSAADDQANVTVVARKDLLGEPRRRPALPPPEPLPFVPLMVSTLPSFYAGRRLRCEALRIKRGDIGRFLREDLRAGARALPILAMPKGPASEALLRAPLIKGRGFTALAEIYVIDRAAVRVLQNEIGAAFIDPDAGAWLLWPGLDPDAHGADVSHWPSRRAVKDPDVVLAEIYEQVAAAATPRAVACEQYWHHLDRALADDVVPLFAAGNDRVAPAGESVLAVAPPLHAPPPLPALDDGFVQLRAELKAAEDSLATSGRKNRQLERKRAASARRIEELQTDRASQRAKVAEDIAGAEEARRALEARVSALMEEVARDRADRDLVRLADDQFSEVADLRTEVARLRYENSAFARRLAEADGGGAVTPDDLPSPQPASVGEAVEVAEQRLARLRFSPESKRSAAAAAFTRPSEVYRAFAILDALAGELAEGDGSVGGRLQEWLRERGLVYSPLETNATMARWAQERRASCEGKVYVMTKHLRWNGQNRDSRYHMRLYFEWDPDERYIVVGHTGAHLTNMRT